MASKFNTFLNTHKTDKDSTHTSMTGGKWKISKDDTNEFFQLYDKALNTEEYALVERHLPTAGQIVVDLDFKLEKKPEFRIVNEKMIKDIVKQLTSILKDMF